MHQIHDLRHLSPPSQSLLAQLRHALTPSPLIDTNAGDDPEDVKFGFKKRLPTMMLYDELGLKLYEKITTDCPSYYLYPLELSLLKAHSQEIVALLFPPTTDGPSYENDEDSQGVRRGPIKRWRVADWGSSDVGLHNRGVNGEQGFDAVKQNGKDLQGVVLELGAGSLSKTSHFLKALAERPSAAQSKVQYLALDLDKAELDRTLSSLSDSSLGPIMEAGGVSTGAVWGTFDAGLQWVQDNDDLFNSSTPASEGQATEFVYTKQPSISDTSDNSAYSPPQLPTELPASPPRSPPNFGTSVDLPSASQLPVHFLFLGSSLGNFDRKGAAEFLRSIPLRPGSGDRLVLGLDGRNEKEVVERAYNDPEGVTKRWAENMWKGVEREIGWKGPGEMKDSWSYEGRYNVKEGRHEAYFRSQKPQTISIPKSDEGKQMDVEFEAGELVNIEWSYKYSPTEALALFNAAELRPVTRFPDPEGKYNLWVLERPAVSFLPLERVLDMPVLDMQAVELTSRDGKGQTGVPSLDEWETVWAFWDTVSIGMIRNEMLHEKPIDLRHKNLFYLGHIPAFLDIFLSRQLKEPHSEPEYYKDLFERGIDPNVDDPEQCHSHSIVPEKDEDWPSLGDILQFRNRVRERLVRVYNECAEGKRQMSRRLGRVLFMTYEHEVMHAETLLYMLIQHPSTLAPPGFADPSFDTLARLWDAQHKADALLPFTIDILQTDITLGHRDLEAEDEMYPDEKGWEDHVFGWDNEHGVHHVSVPAFRIDRKGITNGEYKAFLGNGKVERKEIPKSWIEVDGEWKVKTVYGPVSFSIAQHWPLMASYDEHLAFAQHKGGRLPTEAELRVWLDQTPEGDKTDWEGSNTGLKNWHPIPAALSYKDVTGRVIPGHNGGVWEWTSTSMQGHPAQTDIGQGYVPSELYPGYSSDFFDGVHHVVLGGSFVTLPRFAGRRTVRNFYQHNYPYAWVGARVCYDL